MESIIPPPTYLFPKWTTILEVLPPISRAFFPPPRTHFHPFLNGPRLTGRSASATKTLSPMHGGSSSWDSYACLSFGPSIASTSGPSFAISIRTPASAVLPFCINYRYTFRKLPCKSTNQHRSSSSSYSYYVCACEYYGVPSLKKSRRLLSTDLVGSAIGFIMFTVILSSWALTFAFGGERLFGHVWEELVMYNVADKYGLTGWI
ncbi:probable gamma-secretase subunit pen-2 [Phtheirospermum japonicum]|uniref:Probable gamma-secretase subunit pen-2 n=1 Tax=Phtheirospermum japonicum TaxID=374723 RepID=A0A830CVX5_9LAMI|nr:probable gamma-secretase subunit pen-2 [Phtheirospermum japonicum]